jgi:4-hydroxybenzoate polyprenyltransferase
MGWPKEMPSAINSPVRAYLQLIRLPNVFTALADIAAGFLIVRFPLSRGGDEWTLAPLCLASASLYLAGMAFNDIADREEDKQFRPNRPIPSGKISLSGAVRCAMGLWLFGCLTALVAGWVSGVLAVALGLAVLAYDFFAKRVVLCGTLSLGLCRFLNMLLGMSSESRFLEYAWEPSMWNTIYGTALAIGLYAAGLTAFSAQEEGGKRARWIAIGWVFVGASIVLAGWASPQFWVWLAMGPLALLLAFRTAMLIRRGTPMAARQLVLSGVLGICLFDAGLVLGHWGMSGRPYSMGIVLLVVPALVFARLLSQKEA